MSDGIAGGERSGALWLVATALIIRVAFVGIVVFAAPAFKLTADSQRYDRLALNLVHRSQFRAESFTLAELGLAPDFEQRVLVPGYLTGSEFPDATHFEGPELKRVPLFAVFLGLVHRVFGYNPHLFLFVQAVIGAMTCWLLYRIGRLFDQPKIGLLAGILLALNPRSIVFVGKIQVETYFTWVLVLTLLAGLRYARRPTWPAAILFAVALGVSTLSREMGLFLALVFMPVILYPALRARALDNRHGWAKSVVIVAVSAAVIAGWVARNHRHYGRFVWTSHTSFTQAWHFGPAVLSAAWGVSEHEARVRICRELVERHPEYEASLARLEEQPTAFWGFNQQIEMNRRAARVVRPHLVRHPVTTLSSFAGGAFWSMWAGIGDWRGLLMSDELYRERQITRMAGEAKKALFSFELRRCLDVTVDLISSIPAVLLLLFAYIWLLMVILYVSTVLGVVPAWRTHSIYAVQLLVLIAFAAAVTGPAGTNRLFVMAYPFISLLSAGGLTAIVSRWRRARGTRCPPASPPT